MNWRVLWAAFILCGIALYLCSRPLDVIAPDGIAAAVAHTESQRSPWNNPPEWTVAIASILTLFGILYQAEEMKKATLAMRENTEEAKKQTVHIGRQAQSMRYQTTHLKNTAIQTGKSANAAKTGAKAALLNARAVINSERPWIVVEIESLDTHFNTKYLVVAKNKGRTPAEIVDGICGAGAYKIEDSAPTEERMAPFLVSPQPLTVSDGRIEIKEIVTTSHLTENAKSLGKILTAFGKIRYWDMFTDRSQPNAAPYETQWCLTYNDTKKEWHRSANGYSKNT